MKQIISLIAVAIALGLSSADVESKSLRWASQGDVATHDPHAQNESFNNQFNGQIYEQLLARDKTMKLIPGLATAWKQTSPTTWLFNLRKGVKWQDGSNFTADDVVFSIIRSQQPTSNMKVYGKALGVPKRERGKRSDELLAFLQAATEGDILTSNDEPLVIKGSRTARTGSRAECRAAASTRPRT